MTTSTLPVITLSVLVGNDPVALLPLQALMLPHLGAITSLWMAVWCTTLVYLLYRMVLEMLAK